MKMAELKMQVGFGDTLGEANKIFLKSWWLIASIASFTTLVYALLLLTNFLSLRSLIADLIAEQTLLLTSPSSLESTNLLVTILHFSSVSEWIFVLIYSLVSVLLYTAVIMASALSHAGQDTNSLPRDVALAVARSLKRPLITYFYVSIFCLGYSNLILAIQIMLPMVLSQGSAVITVTTCIFGTLFYAYLSVVWLMGMVVSVLEEKSGMKALEKVAQLIKGGLHPKGYCISLVVTVVSYGVMMIWRLAIGRLGSSPYVLLLVGMVAVNGLWLVRAYELIGFTVLYYEGKRSHGEETEMVLSMDCTKIPSLPLIANRFKFGFGVLLLI